jgi:twitching motility protein PilT
VNKPLYEIPVTDPANPPLGVPGAAGAMPPPRGMQPPMPPGSTGVDLSQLPPPAVASIDAAASAPAPPAAGAIPGYTPAPIPGYTPAPGEGSIPGYTPAPSANVLPIPDFTIIPPISQRFEKPKRPAFVPDDFTLAARARVDAELLMALETVVTEGASDLHISIGAPPMIRIDGGLRAIEGMEPWDRERVAAAL